MLWDLISKEGCNRVFKIDLNRLCNWLCSSSHHFWVHLGKVLKAQQQNKKLKCINSCFSHFFCLGGGASDKLIIHYYVNQGGEAVLTLRDMTSVAQTPLAHATMLRDTSGIYASWHHWHMPLCSVTHAKNLWHVNGCHWHMPKTCDMSRDACRTFGSDWHLPLGAAA